jgi:hypothetical protein
MSLPKLPPMSSTNMCTPILFIGTYEGDFADMLMVTWKGRKLYCVDPWQPGYDNMDPASSADMVEVEAKARKKLDKYGKTVHILKETSAEAASQFDEGQLDFVYLDGRHQTDSMAQDLSLWWPKLRSGGILAGHDIVCPGEKGGGWGAFIQLPIFLHARMNKVIIYLVPESEGKPWSYYMVKK